MSNIKFGIAGVLGLVVITACTTVPTNTPTPFKQEITCSLTCDNPIYMKPGNQKFPARKLLDIRKDIGQKIQQSYNKLLPDEGGTLKANPTEALTILNTASLTDLNAREIAQIKQLKGYSYTSMNQYKPAIEEFKSVLALSPQISLTDEKWALKNLWMLHSTTEKYAEALEYVEQWRLFVDRIEAEEYNSIAAIYIGLKDYSNAIANLERGIEINDAKFGKNIRDYQKLKSFYQLANDSQKTKEIDDIILSIPNPPPWIAVSPVYPDDAKSKGIEGYCIVTFDIRPDGSTYNVHIKPGHCKTYSGELTDLFSASSIDAVKQFAYQPTNDNDQTVDLKNATFMVTFKNKNPQ